jgi:hypothetical protein
MREITLVHASLPLGVNCPLIIQLALRPCLVCRHPSAISALSCVPASRVLGSAHAESAREAEPAALIERAKRAGFVIRSPDDF